MEIFWVIIVLQAFICGLLSTTLAEHKGYSTGAWFASGFFFGIFGLIAAAGLPSKRKPTTIELLKKCPDCAESIRKEALICKFCGREFSKEQVIGELISILGEKSMTNKLQALDALRTIKDASVIFPKWTSHVVKLIETLTIASGVDPNLQLLDKAIQVLSEVGSPSLSPDLVSLLEKTENMIKAGKLIELIARLRGPSSIPAIIACLKMEGLRNGVAEVLQDFREAALPHLDQLMKDGNRGDRVLAERIAAEIRSTSRE